MVIFSDVVQMRAGATPHTFDGAQTLDLNERAKDIIAMIVSQSLSAWTTDEGLGMAIQLDSSNWNGNRYFFAGWMSSSGPTTNHAATLTQADVVPLKIPVGENTSVNVNISAVLGATQTGTFDVTIGFLYSDGEVPSDVMDYIQSHGVRAAGGQYAYTQALATTTRTALTNNANAFFNIPASATEIIGFRIGMVLDGAVTQLEETSGLMEIDTGISDQGVQKYAFGGGSPGIGTEVEGGNPVMWQTIPAYIPLPNREIKMRGFVTLMSAITGGMDIAVNVLWR